MTGYRTFIDFMVDLARMCVHADRLNAHGHAERTNERAIPLSAEEVERKQVMRSLTAPQRAVVAGLLKEERVGAIHDVLANLPAFDFLLEGRPLFDQADEMPHGDFLARLEGHPWRE